jgi:predicted ATPase
MGLIESFRVQPIAEGRKEYEVLLKTRRGSDEVNLADVGFGISQVLPVLVQCFYAPANSILILEQPEIHLHPRVQASLADLFIETIHAREGSKNRNLQLLVESHSEHFLRRLQRRIAEEKLRPEEVAIYFCEPSTRGSKIQELEIDLFGNIRNWPEDFFGDEMGDLAAMTEAAMTRQAQGARR